MQNGSMKQLAGLVLLSVFAMPLLGSAAGNSVVANDTLPDLDRVVAGNVTLSNPLNNVLDVTQGDANAIINWKDFSIGANATVNFNKNGGGTFNTLNYVTGSNMSQLYGKLNATGGNIFLVNPNGVQIGNSAQINVGSLHVANKKIDNIDSWQNGNFSAQLAANTNMTNAELMSLGNINATNLTFEGQRVVLDLDRLSGLSNKQDAVKIVSIREDLSGNFDATKKDNRLYDVVLGTSDVSDANIKSWSEKISFINVKEPGTVYAGTIKAENPDKKDETVTSFFTYRWIKDGSELAKIGTDAGWGLDGHYALRYAIDLTGSEQTPIGTSKDKTFTGKFDGLHNNIFGLTIDNSNNSKAGATGLFGFTNGATIGNFNLIAGTDGVSIKGGTSDTGALIGHAVNTKVNSVTSTLKVQGTKNVGGLIGTAVYDKQAATVKGKLDTSKQNQLRNLINTGNVSGKENVGGIVGSMIGGTLGVGESDGAEDKQTHNLGKITGINAGDATTLPDGQTAENYYSHNIGGLVGYAENAVIGAVQKNGDVYTNNKNTLYNAATVEGGYNVGGIVGSATGTTIQNAANEGNILATGYVAEDYFYHSAYQNLAKDALKTNSVRVANAGGIAGSTFADSKLINVENKGDVEAKEIKKTTTSTKAPSGFDHYGAGNIGGVIGRAEDTNITQATNTESDIRGAMNVGGIAGYFGSTKTGKDYRILNATNNGGDIAATGGLKAEGDSFAKEIVHRGGNNEEYITGNIGGIAGYLYGNAVHIEASDNRGTVHTTKIVDFRNVPETAKAANVGGIAGRIDKDTQLSMHERLDIIKSAGDKKDEAGLKGEKSASVSASSNTGEVSGYANIGGIGGFAYNGSISTSYNLGKINTTRRDGGGTVPTNIGGILGDSMEQAQGRVILYDVYNKGEIGDAAFNLYARHVGGIVGRLSGIVEKAYNTGNIYNGSSVVGGITGYWYYGELKNVFNTGNITVVNNNSAKSQVGGIVGSVNVGGGNDGKNMSITNAYNLGSLRSFKVNGTNSLGGIVGGVANFGGESDATGRLSINNVYTGGNLYVDSGSINALVGNVKSGSYIRKNAYYIRPAADNGYTNIAKPDAKAIDFNSKFDKSKYTGFTFSSQNDGTISVGDGQSLDDTWRMVDGSGLPILNAFLPGSYEYFSKQENWQDFKDDNAQGNVIYGTAYNPLLTIIHSQKDLTFNWSDMHLKNHGALAVFGIDDAKPNLTLNNVQVTNSTGIFGGLLYSDGVLNLNSQAAQDIYLGAGAQLYGSSINLNADGKLTIAGTVTATGNKVPTQEDKDNKHLGININAGELDVYGKIKTAQKGTTLSVAGIGEVNPEAEQADKDKVQDRNAKMTDLGERFSHMTTHTTEVNGNLNITTKKNTLSDGSITSGAANILYGNLKTGKVDAFGEMNIASEGKILVDTDLNVGSKVTLATALDAVTGNPAEAILDISNIDGGSAEGIQKFLGAHSDEEHGVYGSDVRIAIDAWNADKQFTGDSKKGNFDYAQFDYNGSSFQDKLNKLYVETNGTVYGNGQTDKDHDIHNVFYTWVSTAEQLSGIQHYAEHSDSSYKDHILTHNFMLKNDIDASEWQDFESIGRGSQSYSGHFDGRNQRIIGLTAKNGLFTNNAGTIDNLNIYSSVFTGKANTSIGAVAAHNTGSVENVVGLGNTIKGDSNNTIGGLIGTNNQGLLRAVSDQSTVIAGSDTVAGGLVGLNDEGFISDVESNSAVTTAFSAAENKFAQNLGGIAGKNITQTGFGEITDASVHGVTGKANTTKNSGGIVGTNSGLISNAYNESIIHGKENLGGIAGVNTLHENGDHAYIEAVANALEIIGDEGSKNVGGLVGEQGKGATLAGGRNTGVVQGTQNVGGFVGSNAQGSSLSNLENAPQASVIGVTNVGGIAGINNGSIIVDSSGLENEGKVYGVENVGGTVGFNDSTGIVKNINSNMELFVNGTGVDAKYFGGVVGKNAGKVINATNSGKIIANDAAYVGGIIGYNTAQDAFIDTDGSAASTFINKGEVSGKNFVGGIVGLNEAAKLDGVAATNKGSVTASAGGAGGIFGKYTGAISNSVLTNAGNVTGNGTVSAAGAVTGTGGITGVNSGAISSSTLINTGSVRNNGSSNNVGGIFGVKDAGTITDSTLQNAGTVAGNTNVGGVIGMNKVEITRSNLTNEIDAQVVGVENVGGLIGDNAGNVSGGRDAADNYYKYKVYNNGVITAGELEEDGTLTNVAGANIGGLLGLNSGSLNAAYNTGALKAAASTNVGGIAGTNSGNITQVFNTVAVRNGNSESYSWSAGSVSGKTNVGGIVGNNASGASVADAYNTTGVSGATNAGSITGVNNGSVNAVYNSNGQSGQNVVGSGKAAQNAYSITAGTDAAKKASSYPGFDFNGTTWKIYAGYSSPLLKIFLTKVTYDAAKDTQKLIYDGESQHKDISRLVRDGALCDLSGQGFAAYKNAGTSLINNDNSYNADVGSYHDLLWSLQLGYDGFDGTPNNLGYDLPILTYNIEASPDIPPHHFEARDDYWFASAPWDKQRSLRERKAELHYVAGGIALTGVTK